LDANEILEEVKEKTHSVSADALPPPPEGEDEVQPL